MPMYRKGCFIIWSCSLRARSGTQFGISCVRRQCCILEVENLEKSSFSWCAMMRLTSDCFHYIFGFWTRAWRHVRVSPQYSLARTCNTNYLCLLWTADAFHGPSCITHTLSFIRTSQKSYSLTISQPFSPRQMPRLIELFHALLKRLTLKTLQTRSPWPLFRRHCQSKFNFMMICLQSDSWWRIWGW